MRYGTAGTTWRASARLWAGDLRRVMIVLARAVTYAALFIGLVLVFLPARVLSSSGIAPPPALGVPQVAGLVMSAAGAVLALWCVATFAIVGRGTPAPFDPPRRLVMRGPYRVVRNPMYIGAGLALAGAALYYESGRLAGYAALFLPARGALFRGVVRRADAAPDVRGGVRGL
jgi:protein-S-isoprenylcysteine O-methyltransferase Ste14